MDKLMEQDTAIISTQKGKEIVTLNRWHKRKTGIFVLKYFSNYFKCKQIKLAKGQ